MKILFLSRWFPYPTDNGSKLRIYNLLRGLARYHDVTLLSFADRPDVSLDAAEIREICSDVQVVPWREFNPKSARAWVGFLSLKPRSIIDTFSPEMVGKITQLLNTQKYDLVIASQLSMAAYRPYFKNIPAIFEEVEIGLSYGETFQNPDLKKRLRHAFTWFKLRIYLSRLLRSFEACTVVSEQECQLLLRNFSKNIRAIEVIPNCIQISAYESLQVSLNSNQLIFSGSFRYNVNYEAMLWFIREVYPRILKKIPSVHLVITGDHANLQLPSTQNITLTGYVNDINILIASSWVSIIPLWNGGGTRLKVLEAMAAGTPVVSTSKGVEGLNSKSGEHFLVADSPDVFADQVIRLLEDKTLHDQLSTRGKQFVKDNYNWELVLPRFLRLLENTIG